MKHKELKDLAIEVHDGAGHALQAERIIGQARKLSKVTVVPGTSTHKMQEIVLKKNAFCVIDRPFRLRDTQFQLVSQP